MCILMFDIKMSLSGDDSDYLIEADAFWRHFTFPGGKGMLYALILSPFVGIFGFNLLLLKVLSAIFTLLSIYLLYKSFRGIIPAVVLMPGMILVSICSYIFFYACHTYSEPFFMLMQGAFFYFFSKYFLRKDDVSCQLKTDWRKYLLIAFLALCMVLTRTIGYGVLGTVILYFIFQRRWKDLLYMAIAFILVFSLFQILKAIIWPNAAGSVYSVQSLLSKNAYDMNQGMEDIPGLFKRLKENSIIYLSSCLYQFMGLIKETPSNYINWSPPRAIAMYVLFAVFIVFLFKRNKALFFIGLYAGVMNFFSFVLLQSSWAQDRLIMVYYPFILLFLLGGVCYLFQIKAIRKAFIIYPLVAIIIGVGTFTITKNRISRNLPVLQQNLLGDELYGYTPDWYNFVKGAQWANKHLEKDAVIVSRKPSFSKVYTGRDFASLPHALTVPYDDLFQLKSTDEHTILVLDATKTMLTSPHIRYIVNTSKAFQINNQNMNGLGILEVPAAELDTILHVLDEAKMNYTLDYDSFIQQNKASYSDIRIYDPDMMYRYLLDNHVEYLLLPQLRVNPTQKTGMYINNIHRYKWFISYKYPNAFQTIYAEGKDEPCEIIKFIH